MSPPGPALAYRAPHGMMAGMWRDARPTDDDAIVGMFLALNHEDPGQLPVDRRHIERTLTVLRAEPARGKAVVAEVDGRVIGYALLIPFWSNELGGEVCTIDELYVVPDRRGRGIGRRLVASLCDDVALWPGPAVALGLEVSPANGRARRFFESCGFVGGNTTMHLRRQVAGQAASAQPRLYRDLTDWYPLLTPVAEYAEETAFYRRLFERHCQGPPQTLLDLGSGAGHNAAHLQAAFSCMLVDLSPDMLTLSRRLNPGCEHVQGDMRTVRLGRVFDCVLVHDAVSYMTTRADLAAAVTTAFVHTRPGGVALFQPDYVAETFAEGTDSGGVDADGRGLRYLEWRWQERPGDATYVADMAYLLRQPDGRTEVIHDRHVMGLFPRAVWLELIAAAGFQPLAVPFPHSTYLDGGLEVFLGVRSVR